MNKPTAKSVIVVAIAVLAVAAGAYYFLAPHRQAAAQQAQAAPKPALTVTVETPRSVRLPIRLAANGNIAAWQEAVIGAESSGLRLTEVRVNVGDVVKAGQVLATFSSDSVQADVAQARASLLEAQANAADAAANAERARSLQSSGALSTQQINQYLTTEKTAKARAEAAQSVLGAQQLRGRQTQVLAPDSGVISARTATVGSVVGSGAELFRMIRQGRLEWRAELAEAELARVTPGDRIELTTRDGTAVIGQVRAVSPGVDASTRTGTVYADLPDPQGLQPGTFLQGRIDTGIGQGLTVPAATVVQRDGHPNVFAVDAKGIARRVRIRTGGIANGQVEVLEGLKAGDAVVEQGAGFLADGDSVRIVEATATQIGRAHV